MASARRHRSSTAASRAPPMNNQIAELRSLADELIHAAEGSPDSPPTSEVLQAQSNALRRMRQLLIESHERTQTKDGFRHVRGFDVLLQTLRSLSGFYQPAQLSPPDRIDFFDVIKNTLDVLSDALNEHSGNRRYFATRVEGGGWSALEQALGSTGIFGGQPESRRDDAGQEQLFGSLFAFAVGEEAVTRIFRHVDKTVEQAHSELRQTETQSSEQTSEEPPEIVTMSPRSIYSNSSVDTDTLRAHVRTIFSGNEVLQNPDIIPTILHFWLGLSNGESPGAPSKPLSIAVLLSILEIVALSSYNKAAVHITGVLSIILPLLFDHKCAPAEARLLRELADQLIEFGINKLGDAYYLFRKAAVSDSAAEFLHQGMHISRGAPFIQFDLSLHGFSAIELPDLGCPFPPVSPGGGYTFAAWIRVDQYDSKCHTTIFGAYDDTQTCFLMAYLEKDTRCFILQTYMGHSAGIVPSVRFKKAPCFQEGRWYHIAVVHRRAKAMGLGSHKASLFVDGEFTETLKSHYPSHPPVLESSQESFASLSSSRGQHHILAFLGTPRNLAPLQGRNVLASRLSMASFHLFAEPLSDELIAVYHKLGPRYSGNFQDKLGSFQTYRTSAELHVQNGILHPGKEEHSDIVSAMSSNAGNLMPESKILLSFSPSSVMDDDDRNAIDESQLIRSLSKDSARVLHRYTRMYGTPIIINAAVPSVNDALSQPRGFGRLSGDAVVVVPQALDDAIWRIGGCSAVGLKLVQSAQSLDGVLRAVKILLEAVEGNWRNCEAMEQSNGFAILAEVLRQKVGPVMLGLSMRTSTAVDMSPDECEAFVLQLLRVVLRFVGYDEQHPTESLIINPLAYRVLVVDLEIWRRSTSLETQKLYYKQFIDFARGSKHHHYNAKRYQRIRVVKRLTEALKGESFSPQIFPLFLDAFKVLLQTNFNGENSRSLALFVTYALYDSRASYAKRPLRAKASTLRLRKGTPPTFTPGTTPRSASPGQDPNMPPGLPLAELGVAVLEMLAELLCDPSNPNEIIRFAKNVTGKWLLYLFAESNPRVVVLAAKILARLLVANGPHYVKKFTDKTGGFIILKNRLRHWWNTPGIWTICFALLFGLDVATIDFECDFDVFNLVELFITRSAPSNLRIVYPGIFAVITAMLDTGLRAIVRDPSKPENEAPKTENGDTVIRGRRRTMSLNAKQPTIDTRAPQVQRLNDYASVLNTAIQFLSELHSRSEAFRDFASSSSYVQELLFILYPVIVSSDCVSAETELLSRDSALTFEGQDVVIQPLSQANSSQTPIVRTATVRLSPSPSNQRVVPLRRASSFVLVSADRTPKNHQTPKLNPILSTRHGGPTATKVGSSVVEAMLEVVLLVFQDELFNRKDFPGLGLFMKTPPGFQEHQAYFESYILRQTIASVSNALRLDQNLLHEPRVLINLSRLITHVSEAVFEGWFLEGADPLLDFAGFLLEYLERPDISKLKSVRLCTQAIKTIRATFLRVILLRLAEPDNSEDGSAIVRSLEKMIYWQPIILSTENTEELFLRLTCYLLYTKLSSTYEGVRLAAANFWRLLLVQKPTETSSILSRAIHKDKPNLYDGFQKLVELDNETFLLWFDGNKADLDSFFYGTLTKTWEDYACEQNKQTENTSQKRITKRKEKLRQWHNEELANEHIWSQHENTLNHWRSNIHASERTKHQRDLQDQQENATFLATVMSKLDRQLRGPCALFEDSPAPKWRLDETEGRDRKRIRIIIDNPSPEQVYQPKRKDTDPGYREKLKLDTAVAAVSTKDALGVTPTANAGVKPSSSMGSHEESKAESDSDSDDDFEMVQALLEDEDGFEDKNRKVMRSLNRGDQVEYVCNISRVLGLEAIEGLLIVGKDCLYLLDDFFQRADGEIVRVWQAPIDEMDPYVQVIAGKEAVTNRRPPPRSHDETARHWKWSEVISVSKRRFLHRDVAIEIFFDDGRSYLLTAMSSTIRNDIHSRLTYRAPHVLKPDLLANSEISWRLDSLRNPEEAPQTLGSRFASAFSSVSSHPVTRKWMKGEISNFHYLMFINTLAGRTFNDLTQYPVFPWVISNYTDTELDLTDPKNFRDLTKPIGIQDAQQEASVRDRFNSFAEMGDNEHAFHYGTHYSSAMTVASYLMRLQPFSAAFSLIQGGSWDHADRMFYSIQGAWDSVSSKNMADVRELTPEFFFLPDFLTNVNGYDFGLRASGESIDEVALPPWARGDPAVFIEKQREALESPYVSKNLHHWIDLIFGYKQRGEAAKEAANVYHWTTYQGAINLDSITDEAERATKISIINNFGQTPVQIFQRPHFQKEVTNHKLRKLDIAAESLHRVPGTLLESNDRVSSLAYISKHDKLLCSAPFRQNIPPHFDRYMEWGFTDGSVRFYDSSSKKPIGIFEHLHSGQLTASCFVDGRTLITAGTDCTIAIWKVIKSDKGMVELQWTTTLFGHKRPVVTLAASRALSAFLSASSDGRVFLWDLNRFEFVRELDLGPAHKRNPVAVQAAMINNVTGHISIACGPRLMITTLNGKLLLDQDISDGEDDFDGITALAVYEGVGNEWCERELIFTGHRRGVVKIFHLTPSPPSATSAWCIKLIKLLNHGDVSREDGLGHQAPITCILPMAHNVYTGDEEGRVYEWNCVHRGH